MTTRVAFRHLARRFSSNGRILSEEEKAAENVYIKKAEREKLEKLARQGPKPEDKAAAGSGGSGSVSDPKPSGPADAKSSTSTSSSGVSTDEKRNYAVIAGVVTALSAFGWYYLSKEKKSEENQD